MERSSPPGPALADTHNGLSYALWLPSEHDQGVSVPGVIVVHGAGSRKENHADFARLANANGWAALTFDLPGHGRSEPEMTGDVVAAVISMVDRLAVQPGVDPARIVLRGSSLGGFLAISAAADSDEVAGVIAICPASPNHLARGVRSGRFEMRIGDPLDLEAWLLAHDIGESVRRIAGRPLILLHAEGDTQIPSQHSAELYEEAAEPRKLVIVPGGAHTTVQHDAELQSMALRWVERELRAALS